MKPLEREQYKIVAVKLLSKGRLRLKYVNAAWIEVDLSELIGKGGLAGKLADPGIFSRGRTQDYGSYMEWPNGLTLSAETLWEWGKRVVGDDELAIGATPGAGNRER